MLRTAALLAVTVLALAVGSASAAPTVTHGISPGLVHQGQKTTLTARVAKNAVCTAGLTYSNGRIQMAGPKRVSRGQATFVMSIPADAAVGQGHWSVNCNIGPSASGTFVVVTAKSTASSATPRVVVSKQGFSQKPDSWGGGSHVSFGLVLHNNSTTDDAANVYVIVNFVSSSGALIGSYSKTLPLVQSGVDYAYGDSMGMRTQEAVASLEISVRVGAHQRKVKRVVPDFANVRIMPNQFDTNYVGEVDGEIVNDNSPLTLTNVNLSIAVLDASGVPIGGGTGYSNAAQPPNTRFVFLAQSGFDAIPMSRAASVLISASPTYGPAL